MKAPDPKILPDWRAVALDETYAFNLQEEDKPFIQKIMAVYFFDRNTITYLCSSQRCYWLQGLHYTVHFAEKTPEEILERICARYTDDEGPEDSYYVEWDIEPLPMTSFREPGRFRCGSRSCRWTGEGREGMHCPRCDHLEVEENSDTAEEVREFWQGNHPY